MPELSGPELATRIRTVHPAIRVLLVSGYSADAVARHGVDGAAPSFLQKPFTGQQLAREGTRRARRRSQPAADRPPGGAAMTPAATMVREADRLEALRSCAIIDTQPEADFDDLVAVAAVVAEVPHACIAFVDETRWWVKAWVGQMRARAAARRRCSAPSRLPPPSRWSWTTSAPIRALPLHPALESDPAPALLRRAAAGARRLPGGRRAVPVGPQAARAAPGAARGAAAGGPPGRPAGVVPPPRDGAGRGARGAGDWRSAVPAARRHGHRRDRDRRRQRADPVRQPGRRAALRLHAAGGGGGAAVDAGARARPAAARSGLRRRPRRPLSGVGHARRAWRGCARTAARSRSSSRAARGASGTSASSPASCATSAIVRRPSRRSSGRGSRRSRARGSSRSSWPA